MDGEREGFLRGRRYRLARQGLLGFCVGYMVIHPASMLIFEWQGTCLNASHNMGPVLHAVTCVLHLHGVPMGLSFGVGAAVVFGLTGFQRIVIADRNIQMQLQNKELEREVASRKSAEDRLRDLSRHDALTGLVNRRRFLEQLEIHAGAARRHGHPLSVCFGDIDKFKAVNDTHGHRVGDDVLATLGRIIRESLRTEDVGARYGGDEFCMIFPYSTAAEAGRAVERIRAEFERTNHVTSDGEAFRATATFGLAELLSKDMASEDLLEVADQALYQAKQSGRNRVAVSGTGGQVSGKRKGPPACKAHLVPEVHEGKPTESQSCPAERNRGDGTNPCREPLER